MPHDSFTIRTDHRSPRRPVQQIARLCDLFEAKTSDLNQTVNGKSQDLQRLCSQIIQAIMEM